MSSSTVLFVTLRALHVLLGAAWLGTSAFLYLFLAPALEEVGPASVPIMTAMGRRGLTPLIASIGGTTVLTGLWLYWHVTGGFEPALSATIGARVFGTGGVAGILALIISGAIVGRTSRKLDALVSKATATQDSAQRATLLTEIAAAKRRLFTYGKVVVALQVVALVCMAVGHYV